MFTEKNKNGSTTIKERVYYELMESILKGELKPDEIINEKSLVEHFKVSKSPIREALIELCNERVLRSIPRYGYEIIRLTDTDLKNIREYRLVVECGFLDKHWDMLTPEKIEGLKAVWRQDMEKGQVQNIIEHWQRNSRFHLEMISFFANEYLYENLSQALRVSTRAYAQFHWNRWQRTVITSEAEYHQQLISALEEGRKADALHILQSDISEFN